MPRVEFIVHGYGPFPIDKLATEQAFPATSYDAWELLKAARADDGDYVTLLLASHEKPDVEAWRVSGWTVDIRETP